MPYRNSDPCPNCQILENKLREADGQNARLQGELVKKGAVRKQLGCLVRAAWSCVSSVPGYLWRMIKSAEFWFYLPIVAVIVLMVFLSVTRSDGYQYEKAARKMWPWDDGSRAEIYCADQKNGTWICRSKTHAVTCRRMPSGRLSCEVRN